MGITGGAATHFFFDNGLASFGIVAVPRGATRHTQLIATLSDGSTIVGSNDVVGTSAVFYGFQLTPTDLAAGLSIKQITFNHPDGVNRYDDLGFTVAPAIPEPAAASLISLGLLPLLRRRR